MPASKKRVKTYTAPKPKPPILQQALEIALEEVRRAEVRLKKAHEAGRGSWQATRELEEEHLTLRSAALGLMIVYAQRNGLPDPRSLVN